MGLGHGTVAAVARVGQVGEGELGLAWVKGKGEREWAGWAGLRKEKGKGNIEFPFMNYDSREL